MKYIALCLLLIGCVPHNQKSKLWVQDDLYCWKYDQVSQRWVVEGLNSECPDVATYNSAGPQ